MLVVGAFHAVLVYKLQSKGNRKRNEEGSMGKVKEVYKRRTAKSVFPHKSSFSKLRQGKPK